MSDNIYLNYKPIWEHMHTVWVPERCKHCSSNKIKEIDKNEFVCAGCGNKIEKAR